MGPRRPRSSWRPSPGVTRQEAEIGAIRRLEPETDTGLYDTIAASHAYMLDNYEPGKLNAVIFVTDGKNDDEDGITLDQLQQRLRDLVDLDKEVRPEDIRNVFIDVQTGGVS